MIAGASHAIDISKSVAIDEGIHQPISAIKRNGNVDTTAHMFIFRFNSALSCVIQSLVATQPRTSIHQRTAGRMARFPPQFRTNSPSGQAACADEPHKAIPAHKMPPTFAQNACAFASPQNHSVGARNSADTNALQKHLQLFSIGSNFQGIIAINQTLINKALQTHGDVLHAVTC